MGYDKAVLKAFLENQLKLFPEEVAADEDEAADFLEMCMAVVVNSPEEVLEYFDEAGADITGLDSRSILDECEVFSVGDGRYLIVEG